MIGRLDIAARFPVGDLIFQAKESAAREWFVSTFGNGVNLDIGDHQVLGVEPMPGVPQARDLPARRRRRCRPRVGATSP